MPLGPRIFYVYDYLSDERHAQPPLCRNHWLFSPENFTQAAGVIFDVQYRAICQAPAADLRSRNSS